ncbi:hypothetical protein KUTeg_005381 [Tegillarca granosa]|uniref:Phage protein n=1 Tax=Tegillarca granosa TaxID=220873 RepID=A0ABQ9FLH1_TEGGR|nr:hypothetical protein KUTeg_005381 [Tegillarca granosa]
MEKTYSLIQSEDLACSVIDISTIIKPRKDLESYRKGEYIVARFKGREYSAVISEIGRYSVPDSAQVQMPYRADTYTDVYIMGDKD